MSSLQFTYNFNGWFRTGDLGIIDKENNLFLVVRCKSMLLSSNGQNVYPEEIEVKLNALPYVSESIIVQRGETLSPTQTCWQTTVFRQRHYA